ncbi:MAG TPA: hypothetical protein VN026_06265 [Bacteroidia bacterium]|jgi:hypothetical protein|nr:hypothetical protein [Bacteroidia bacterium]
MKTKFSFIIFLAAELILTTCKKYPENNLWFRTPTNALMNIWKLDQFTVDGADSTNYDDVQMYREKGINFLDESLHYSEQYEGIWKFANKKKDINLETHFSGPPIYYPAQKNLFRNNQTWTIEKLTAKQFWVSVTNGGIKYAIRFKN